MNAEFISLAQAATSREILPRSVQLPQAPRFIFGAMPAETATHYYQGVHLPAMAVHAGTGFDLSDGVLLWHDGSVVLAPELKLGRRAILDILAASAGGQAAFDARKRRRIPGSVAHLVTPGYADAGTWLTDILPRLALLEEIDWHLADLTIPVPHDVPQFGLDLLRLIGVPEESILRSARDEVVRSDELLMPSLVHNGIRCSPILTRFVAMMKAGLVRAGVVLERADSPRRIYLAQPEGPGGLRNRTVIEAMAADAGFAIVRPATLSLSEQFVLFANATHIVGECVPAFAASLLCAPGTVLCGLRGGADQGGFLLTGMAEVLDHTAGYVFGASEQGGGFSVPEKAFADCLRLVFGPHAHFELQARVVPSIPAKAPPTEAPLRGYKAPRHQPLAASVPAWKFWRKPPPVAPTPEPGSLYAGLLENKD